MQMNPSKNKKTVHFIGIGGSGMSGLAELALHRGYSVSGSDLVATDYCQRLETLGARISHVHAAANSLEADVVVFSSAVTESNAEMISARSAGKKIIHRSEFLSTLMSTCDQRVTVAGTHGKTTTTAIIGHVLADLGLDPDVVVGGIVHSFGGSSRRGQGELIVAEADESDGSFLNYKPTLPVLTNIDIDHMEFFGTVEKLVSTFRSYLLSNADSDNCAVIGWDSALARKAAENLPYRRLSYGLLLGSEVRAVNIQSTTSGTTFDAVVERDKISVKTPLFGKHNVSNCLAALAVVRALDADIRQAGESLVDFSGVKRRYQLLLDRPELKVIDDYAHNPGKIQACVSSTCALFQSFNIIVVYQPHRYSRLETMYNDLLGAFAGAHRVLVLPVYAAGEANAGAFTAEKIAADLGRLSSVHALPVANLEEAVEQVRRELTGKDIVLAVGAGDVTKVAESLKDLL